MMSNRVVEDITNFIFVNDMPQKSDVIFIPGSSRWQITEKAAELYHEGYAPYILPAGRYSSSLGHFAHERVTEPRYQGDHKTDFEYCKHILLVNGVPEDAIIREDCSTNTMENAMYSAEVINKMGLNINRGIICCQAFHARRALMSYACHFRETELLVVPTDTQGINSRDWYKYDQSIKKVMREVEKCGKYFSEYISSLTRD